MIWTPEKVDETQARLTIGRESLMVQEQIELLCEVRRLQGEVEHWKEDNKVLEEIAVVFADERNELRERVAQLEKAVSNAA